MENFKKYFWLVIHVVIIVNFIMQIYYSGTMTFSLTPEGESRILFGTAMDLPFEMMVTRRLYAIETWIAIVGLSLYVGLTHIIPSFRRNYEKKN